MFTSNTCCPLAHLLDSVLTILAYSVVENDSLFGRIKTVLLINVILERFGFGYLSNHPSFSCFA